MITLYRDKIVEYIFDLPVRILAQNCYMIEGDIPRNKRNRFKAWRLQFESSLLFIFMSRFHMIRLFPFSPEARKRIE